MSRVRIVASVVATLIILLVGSLVYALQTTPAAQAQRSRGAQPDAKFGCTCTTGGISAGMAILHCTCGNATCLAVRSSASTGEVAVSCK